MIEFEADADLVGQRPDRALRAKAPGVDRSLALKLLRERRILVNGEPATLRTTLKGGDRVRAPVDERRLRPPLRRLDRSEPTAYGFSVIYLDAELCVVDKPEGMATHPGTGAPAETTLTHRVAQWLTSRNTPPAIAPSAAGRLDRGTSGVVVLAIAAGADTALGQAFQSGAVGKEYLALCQGVTREAFSVDVPLTVTRFNTQAGKRKKLKQAETRFQRIAQSPRATLLKALPVTGRTHQIRRHLKAAGHPIIGDERYGRERPDDVSGDRLCLHALRITFAHPTTGRLLEAIAPPSRSFLAAMKEAGLPTDSWKAALS